MGRCEGYYRVENRRCDRAATVEVAHGDERYELCEYHRRHDGPVARWQGDTGRRAPRHKRAA
ncbi:MAG TPA: hypothetical protein VH306_14460 [Gaiellaceae bacterium]|jgi:hypothetical protein